MTPSRTPTIALATGCPAGIGPELLAEILASSERFAGLRLIAIGDERVLRRGAQVRRLAPEYQVLALGAAIPDAPGIYFLDLANLDPASIPMGEISLAAGAFAVANFSHAIGLAAAGHADVVVWTPFNKAAMRLAQPDYQDEIVFTAQKLGFAGTASEFNILPELWNARVTSHVPLSGVAGLITFDKVLEGLRLTDAAMRESGFAAPRIAVAGLNPHAGEGGSFGREEIEVLAPVVVAARALGIRCTGPIPSDTVFVRATRGEFDAVLTMYHDQGQIAMKLIGFEEGVTLLGGFPFPLLTAAHGSAYDIAGKGTAHVGAMMNAVDIAIKMVRARKGAKDADLGCQTA